MNHTCSVPIQLGWVLRCRVVPTAAPLTIVGAHRCSWMRWIMLIISFFSILLLTGCENKQVQNPVIGQVQQIESPLQNTVEGMAKACFTESPERCRLGK